MISSSHFSVGYFGLLEVPWAFLDSIFGRRRVQGEEKTLFLASK